MYGNMMVVLEERGRAPTARTEPKLQWVDDDIIPLLNHDTVLQYAIIAHDAYFRLHERCRRQPIGQVYIYCHHLIVLIVMYPQINHSFN